MADVACELLAERLRPSVRTARVPTGLRGARAAARGPDAERIGA